MFFQLLILSSLDIDGGSHFHSNNLGPSKGAAAERYENLEVFQMGCAQGEYLNLCGECVANDNDTDEAGMDTCGVCGGLGTCRLTCVDLIAEFNQEPVQDSDCQKFISISPGIMDLADSREGTVWLFGEGVPPGGAESVACSVKNGNTDIIKFSGEVISRMDEEKVRLTFPLPDSIGRYTLSCNTSAGIAFTEHLQVVDSRRLRPLAVNEAALKTWKETEVTLNVAEMSGPAGVICFGVTTDGFLLYREWSTSVEGNGLSSRVVCPRLTLISPNKLNFGVAYSFSAIKNAKSLQLTGVPSSPNPLIAVYNSRSSILDIFFDENLDDENMNCSLIFANSSLDIIGEGADCGIIADRISVKMKGVPAINKTNLQFTENIKTKFSALAVKGSISVNFPHKEVKNTPQFDGPEMICPGESPEFSVEGSSSEKWDMRVLPKNLSNIPVGQRQRLNLLRWSTNRTSRKSFMLNSTSLVSGMQYQIEAKGTNGEKVEMEVRVAKPGEVWVTLEGPSMLDIASFAVYKANIKSCDDLPSSLKYVWDLSNSEGEHLDFSLQQGSILRIDGRKLSPEEEYTVSIKIVNEEKVLGSGKLKMRTKMRDLQINLLEKDLVVGTGQAVEIDATRSTNVDMNLLKFKWSCLKGYCFEPQKSKNPLEKLKTFTQPVLSLPPKSLAIGRYEFEVEGVMMSGAKARSVVRLSVVSGQPPYISQLLISDQGTDSNLTISLKVSQIIGSCEFYWDSIPVIGYSYLPINKSSIVLEGSPLIPESRTVSLSLKRSLLKPGARYMLKYVGDCGYLSRSHLQFQLLVPDKFPELHLEVSPINGTALDSVFKYNVLLNDENTHYTFSYGFERNGTPQFLTSSNLKQFTTILGQGIYKPLVKVCRSDSDCTTAFGPQAITGPPKDLSPSLLRRLFLHYSDTLISNDFTGANTFLEMIVPSLRNHAMDSFNNFSSEVLLLINKRVDIYMKKINDNDTTVLEDAVQLLDTASNVLHLFPNHDDLAKSVVKFRDLLFKTTLIISERNIENILSGSLPAEGRYNSVDKLKWKTPILTKDAMESTVHTILKMHLRKSALTNNSEQILEEKVKLLNYTVSYSRQFCNELQDFSFKAVGSAQDFIMIESTKYGRLEDLSMIKFPKCSYKPCPNSTGFISFGPVKVPKKGPMKSDGFCFAMAHLREDILSEVISFPQAQSIERRGPLYWIDLISYQRGEIEHHFNYSHLMPRSSTNNYFPDEDLSWNKGVIKLQIPLWLTKLPNGTSLKCSRFEDGVWNLTSCRNKIRASSNFIECFCQYPGFYSVFALLPNSSTPDNNHRVAQNHSNISIPNSSVHGSMSPAEFVTGNPIGSTKVKGPENLIPTLTTPIAPMKITSEKNSQTTLIPFTTAATKGRRVEIPSQQQNVTKLVETIVTEVYLVSTTPNLEDERLEPVYHYKYIAYFRINQSYSEIVSGKEHEFKSNLENQLRSLANITFPVAVVPEEDQLKVTLKIEENKLDNESSSLALLDAMLRNGTFIIHGLNGEPLSVPRQNLHLMETDKHAAATTAFISVIFILLTILIGSLLIAVYIRTSKEDNSNGLTQDSNDEPPAPKYLRLHDSVILDGSIPPSPTFHERESSLAIVTRAHSRGYEPVDQFSNLPGNI